MNYQQWLHSAALFLTENLNNDPYLNAKVDVHLILQSVTGKSKSQILAFSETELDEQTLEKLTALLQRRATGEPMAYILGETDFWSLNLEVSKDTLIPRPDTEVLVEQALMRIPQKEQVAILDLGTGTGAIALALADELKKRGQKSRVLGVDLMPNAVALAQRNALRNQLPQVNFRQSSWFDNVAEKFDLIVSNPPYIDPQDAHLTQGDVRFEPLTALVSDEEGYKDLRHIIEQAPNYLHSSGWLLLEHGWQQGEKVRSFFANNLWEMVATVKDYGDNERVTLARLK
ncbi:peptide chain release factor N(5)-glutamine methyltransferase [Actinobacillus porcinus]|uniref:peptide chain release factor N(5)-glutamine methyltransferase n=1 Tax=Actinobacillus porcinus TaxID=51048 RepID=UPI002353487D|nr:peptide chain release factor N(5)-glutamine methyltransferase [Actinobacillus porcinus]MCI5764980.1 peptide chain release factor N(5)-glutamine methyltransferase [Actinobacillus porcinus]MDY5422556.1 peptide chain release factor N(5)-glutamine methyltransferase [Actinobacillus porcinus]